MSDQTAADSDPEAAPISVADRIAWFGEDQPPELFALLFDQMTGKMTIGDFRREVRRRARAKGTLQ